MNSVLRRGETPEELFLDPCSEFGTFPVEKVDHSALWSSLGCEIELALAFQRVCDFPPRVAVEGDDKSWCACGNVTWSLFESVTLQCSLVHGRLPENLTRKATCAMTVWPPGLAGTGARTRLSPASSPFCTPVFVDVATTRGCEWTCPWSMR